MTDELDRHGMIPLDDPDGHRWAMPRQPEPDACPNCSCCTARLCEQAAEKTTWCVRVASAADRDTVMNCPCSDQQIKAARAAYRAEHGYRSSCDHCGHNSTSAAGEPMEAHQSLWPSESQMAECRGTGQPTRAFYQEPE